MWNVLMYFLHSVCHVWGDVFTWIFARRHSAACGIRIVVRIITEQRHAVNVASKTTWGPSVLLTKLYSCERWWEGKIKWKFQHWIYVFCNLGPLTQQTFHRWLSSLVCEVLLHTHLFVTFLVAKVLCEAITCGKQNAVRLERLWISPAK
jgi:hypothetical protein